MKSRRILLWTILGVVLVNSIFLASAINIIVQPYFFSSGRFAFQYDETKLVVDRIGNFIYDSNGNLQQLAIYVRNKDSINVYTGYIEVVIESQQYKVDVNLSGGQTQGYNINLNPHLALTGPLVINVNVIVAGAGSGGADLIVQKGVAISDASIDGTIGAEWSDAKSYTNVPITPSGTASIWVKNDGINLYIVVQFTADSNNPWVAFQLSATGCMDAGADGALLGHDSYAANGYVDIKYDGTGPILVDSTQNGKGFIAVGSGNLVTVELKKPLNSSDITGGDIAWTAGSTYSMVMLGTPTAAAAQEEQQTIRTLLPSHARSK